MSNASPTVIELSKRLLERVREVRRSLGIDAPFAEDAGVRFADALDSMAMVEFLLVVGQDCGVPPERIEEAVQHRFTTVADLARALHDAGLVGAQAAPGPALHVAPRQATVADSPKPCLFVAAAAQLPERVQSAEEVNQRIQRPSGWLESHAGILQRRVWGEEDAVAAAARAGRACLEQAEIAAGDVGALLVTSEAPPLLAGLAAALHDQLRLPQDAIALEIGGACNGFLSCLWLVPRLQSPRPVTLVIAVEAHSRYLSLQPGPAGEAAALFGDGAAACLFCAEAATGHALPLRDVSLSADGSAGRLIQVNHPGGGGATLELQGKALSVRAIKAMGRAARTLADKHGLELEELSAIAIHGGNGRFPALFARHLGVPAERVLSQTSMTGNLGSASLPVAWATAAPHAGGPVIWTAVGAGLTWGAALFGR